MKKTANLPAVAGGTVKPAKPAPRGARRVPAKSGPAKPKATHPRLRPVPASLLAVKAAGLPTPVQAAIKLAFPMTPLAITALVHDITEGLNGNLNYPGFEDWEATLAATEGALIDAMDAVTAAEQTAKVARAARDLEVLNAENTLRNVALACEAVDRRDEALLSAGWTLRRIPGGPKPLPAPARLAMRNLPFEGQVEVRWSAVINKRYYEIQATTGGENPDPNVWETLPIIPEGLVTKVFSGLTVGSYLSVRVRAVGAKGPSPWTEAVTLRVN